MLPLPSSPFNTQVHPTYAHTCAHTHTPTHPHTCTHTCTHMHTHTCTHTHTHALAHTCAPTHTCALTHMHTCTHPHIHVRSHTHVPPTHTHSQRKHRREKHAVFTGGQWNLCPQPWYFLLVPKGHLLGQRALEDVVVPGPERRTAASWTDARRAYPGPPVTKKGGGLQDPSWDAGDAGSGGPRGPG